MQVHFPSGCWNFKFEYGVLSQVIEQTLGVNGEEIAYYSPEQFGMMISTISPDTLWPNEYERGVAKCKLFDVLTTWKEI